jgi:hypothetical protein
MAPIPENFEQTLGSEVAEALGLSYRDYILQGVDLEVLLPRNAVGAVSVIWQCPPDYDFVVLRIDPICRSADPAAEESTNDTTLLRLQGFENLLRVKALGITVQLVSETRKGEKIINFDTGLANDGAVYADAKLPLIALDSECGSGPLDLLEDGDFSPLFIKRSEPIKLTADQLAGVGVDTYAGLHLWGVMVHR